MTNARPALPTNVPLMLLARTLREHLALRTGAAKVSPGSPVGYEIDVVRGRDTVADCYLKLPDGTQHGVRRRM